MPLDTTTIDRLFDFIDHSPTAYHASYQVVRELMEAGFTPYFAAETLRPGDRRYVISGGSAVFAFSIGTAGLEKGFRIIGAHTDAPGFKIKPNSLLAKSGMLTLNTEIYGGPILHTWQDRPLSMAGQVALRGKDCFTPQLRLFNHENPLLIIPSLAIHMDREVNQSHKLDKAKELAPVISLDESLPSLEAMLAASLDVDEKEIIDHALFLYDPSPACRLGLNQDLMLASRLDNLGMVHAAVQALTMQPEHQPIHLIALFDHEEVGSRTRHGAASTVLRDLMERISLSLGGHRQAFLEAIGDSFLISADQAHALHPNYSDKSDQTNRPRINAGPVLKTSAAQSYVSELEAMAVFKELCRAAKVPCQTFANRSDQRGGSTLGPLTIAQVPLPAVDVGNPIWGMHSLKETAGVWDQVAMTKVMRQFFSSSEVSHEKAD